MKNCKQKSGVTLVEILVVVVIIGILAGMVIGLARRIDNQGKERLVRNSFEILNCALEQFADFDYSYNGPYAGLDFPLDCSDYPFSNPPNFDLRTTLMGALGAMDVSITSGAHDPNFSGSEAMYFFLSRVPESRQTLAKIDRSLVTNKDYNKQDIIVEITFPDGSIKVYSLHRVIDPWGRTLRYDYYDEWEVKLIIREGGRKTFPVLTSAGPDRAFDTADDISSRK